ncbi:hypothetical protein O6H91_07G103600 [Diphasiastrum complanatum]|uniref:Uncharacterized protein n=1 Tax=Diphasiastrum complanatum TaxID=34168 RepID=A0ACC2D8I3_DIPCM|nr:hypothetical protein O6H91_07G103600 [Diphasiastrum complanatum]
MSWHAVSELFQHFAYQGFLASHPDNALQFLASKQLCYFYRNFEISVRAIDCLKRVLFSKPVTSSDRIKFTQPPQLANQRFFMETKGCPTDTVPVRYSGNHAATHTSPVNSTIHPSDSFEVHIFFLCPSRLNLCVATFEKY